jgi:hypothetical protein
VLVKEHEPCERGETFGGCGAEEKLRERRGRRREGKGKGRGKEKEMEIEMRNEVGCEVDEPTGGGNWEYGQVRSGKVRQGGKGKTTSVQF